MPEPTSSTAIQRPDLGLLAYEYNMTASQRGFIAREIFPVFVTPEKTADYPIIPIEALLKKPADTKRAPRSGYPRNDYQFEDGTYNTHDRGLEEPLDDVERKLYRRFFDAEEVATNRCVDGMLREEEARVAGMVFNATNIPNNGDVSIEWSKLATCTMKADVKDARSTLRLATGVDPDALAVSKTVFDNMLLAKEFKDYLQYTNPHLMETLEMQKIMLARFLGLEKLVVGNALYDSAKKGKPFSLADIWDDEYALLFKLPMNGKDLKEPVLGRTFIWDKDGAEEMIVEVYREEKIRSDIYRCRNYLDQNFMFKGAAYLLGNISE